ncbi:MAG: Chaperone protein HtpG [Chlamydiae bacterium]|nr:Chaperone protein HtpG [Chlamydiota bacterium]
MTQGTLKINTENILPIIKKWLYSDKDIFVRELVSNACDALSKVKILADQNELELGETKITLRLDKEKKTLTIADTGIGMTAEEVEKYIAQVAFSGAEEFLSKYETKNEQDQVIGHFGLGFYSAYMVAGLVEIDTLSYQTDATPALWSCDGGAEYNLTTGSQQERGTTITLHIGDEGIEYLDEAKLRKILNHYCAFLPFPIFFNGDQINKQPPLWNKAPSECTDQEYLEFYRLLYPMEPDPLFWIHLSIDYPFHLKGILYFPKLHRHFDYQKNAIKLFCNRVFVSEDCKELIPDFLTVLRGAIDSPDIPLNVSRSTLQMDRTVRQLAGHISKKVADRLATLHRTEPETFYKQWEDIEMIIKLGAMQDEKFYAKAASFLVWKNLSDEWVTLESYKEKSATDKVFYTQQKHSHFLDLYKEKGLDVLHASCPIDPALMNFLEAKHPPLKFQRVDGGLDDALIDKANEKELLDADGKTEASKMADFVRGALGKENLEVEAKSLASTSLPAIITLDEQMRRIRDTLSLTADELPPGLNVKQTFVVNTNSPLMNILYNELRTKEPELAKELLQEVYELALLSQQQLTPKELPAFTQRTSLLLEQLLSRLK